MLQFNKQFYINVILFFIALIVLGLSIWALVAKCPENFGSNCSMNHNIEGGIIGSDNSRKYA